MEYIDEYGNRAHRQMAMTYVAYNIKSSEYNTTISSENEYVAFRRNKRKWGITNYGNYLEKQPKCEKLTRCKNNFNIIFSKLQLQNTKYQFYNI